MRSMIHVQKMILLLFVTLVFSITANGQRHIRVLEVMDTANIDGQLDYITEHTNIYNGFRAVHEDIFRKLTRNVMDTVTADKNRISNLSTTLRSRNLTIDSLQLSLNDTKEELNEAIETRNNLSFLGIELDKTVYNSIVWAIIFALILLLVLGFLLFKRNLAITQNTKKDLEEIKNEFEDYRKTSRERHEKLVISHFNEIKKLKEGGGA